MKVLLINGSPRAEGNTFIALSEVAKVLQEEGISTEIKNIGAKAVQGCIACYKCKDTGVCSFRDELYLKMREAVAEADGIIIGSPTYYGGPNGSLCALLDRLFFSSASLMAYKPGASVIVCRRGGASAAFDRLNKYFTITNMPLVTSQYWNMVYGQLKGEAAQDAEGLQTMRTIGRNMAWLLKNLKEPFPKEEEVRQRTNFIR
jgi:multimeric flavodoxin WrbA